MPVQVTCSCGQRLSIPDDYVGKAVRCPKCKATVSVPAPASAAAKTSGKGPSKAGSQGAQAADVPTNHEAVFDELGLKEKPPGVDCPECGGHLPPNAVLCVHCGYSFQLGRKLPTLGLKSSAVRHDEDAAPKTEVDKILAFAERELEKEPVRQDLGYGTPTGAWMITAVMLIVFGLAVGSCVIFFNYMEGEAAKQKDSKGSGAVPSSVVRFASWT
jgi:DNA-directed RNA polymerase subunit M/transcription elongation factor TFIIS